MSVGTFLRTGLTGLVLLGVDTPADTYTPPQLPPSAGAHDDLPQDKKLEDIIRQAKSLKDTDPIKAAELLQKGKRIAGSDKSKLEISDLLASWYKDQTKSLHPKDQAKQFVEIVAKVVEEYEYQHTIAPDDKEITHKLFGSYSNLAGFQWNVAQHLLDKHTGEKEKYLPAYSSARETAKKGLDLSTKIKLSLKDIMRIGKCQHIAGTAYMREGNPGKGLVQLRKGFAYGNLTTKGNASNEIFAHYARAGLHNIVNEFRSRSIRDALLGKTHEFNLQMKKTGAPLNLTIKTEQDKQNLVSLYRALANYTIRVEKRKPEEKRDPAHVKEYLFKNYSIVIGFETNAETRKRNLAKLKEDYKAIQKICPKLEGGLRPTYEKWVETEKGSDKKAFPGANRVVELLKKQERL